jgi:hypothetical protein
MHAVYFAVFVCSFAFNRVSVEFVISRVIVLTIGAVCILNFINLEFIFYLFPYIESI